MKKIGSKILLLIFLFSIDLIAQEEEEEIREKLPLIAGVGNVGNDYWVTIPPVYENESGGFANYIKIFVTSAIKTKVTLTIPKINLTKSEVTIPNDVIVFNISPPEGQPFLHDPFATPNGRATEVWNGAGINIKSDDPILVYVVCRYKYTSDGFLAIPVSGLGKDYIVQPYSGWEPGTLFPAFSGVVAAFDSTKVSVIVGGIAGATYINYNGKDITGGQSTGSITMQKGDVLMLTTIRKGGTPDISGSRVTSNKPIAVVSGQHCSNIPISNQWCDYTVEMDLPTSTWGKVYHIPYLRGRRYNGIIRVFAKEGKTNIYKDGQFWFELNSKDQSSTLKGQGWQEARVWPMMEDQKDIPPRNAVITADKPIGITYYNPGVQEDANPQANSDPFAMVMTPLEQYQNEITFCTPNTKGQQGFADNFVNLIYETDENGFLPSDYEFGTVQGGKIEWKSIGEVFGGSDPKFFGDLNGKKYANKNFRLPADGVYKLRGSRPFAAYSYGFGSYDSYGYPTSTVLNDLTIPDTETPEPQWSQDNNGNIFNGLVTDKPDDSALRSNLSIVMMDNQNSYNYKFEFTPIISGETITTSWKLTLIDSKKDGKADLIFIDRAGNDTTITITYKAVVVDNVPLVLDIENELCPNTIVKYELTDKEFYSFNWKITGKYELIDSIKNAVTIKWTEPGLGKIIVNRKNSVYDTTETLNLNLSIKPNPILVFNYNKSYCNQDTISLDFTSNVGLKEYNFVVMKEDNFINYKLVNKSQNQLKIIINEQGEYIVKVFATSDIGCVDSTTLSFEVLDIPLKPELTYEKNVLSSSVTNSTEYIWYIDGEYFTTTKTNKIVPFKEGLYKCLYIDNLGCKSELSEEYNVTFTSVENDTNLKLINSSNALITLEITQDIIINNQSITLWDILGNVINTQVNITGNQIEIKPANKLSTGTYFIQINNSNGSIINNTIKVQIN